MTQLIIYYRCPRCGREWVDTWSSAVDGECPECGLRHITPINWEEPEFPK